jgi:hypothetical protein
MERIETPRNTEPVQPPRPQHSPQTPPEPEPREGTFRDAEAGSKTEDEEIMNTDEEGKA